MKTAMLKHTTQHALRFFALLAVALAGRITPAQAAEISGTISYSGGQTGDVWVIANTFSNSFTTNYGVRLPGLSGAAFTNVHYSIADLAVDTNYWLRAFRDSNGNGTNDTWEASDSYSSDPLYLMADTNGVNFTLTDPDDDKTGIPDWWELYYGIQFACGDGSDGPLVVDSGQMNFIDRIEQRLLEATRQGFRFCR